MKMKMKKTIAVNVMILFVMIAMIPVTAYASLYYFDDSTIAFLNQPVDSNTYTFIATATKATNYDQIRIGLMKINKPGGISSNYKKIKAYFFGEVNGLRTVCTSNANYTLNLGRDETPYLSLEFAKKGVPITFFAMGNNPALDCEITGMYEADY